MVTRDDVLFLMQRGAVVLAGRETQEESERYTRMQIEAIVERETAALRSRAEKAEARSVELEAGLSTCIGWIAALGVGPRINEVLQEAREALAGKGE